MDLKAKLFDIWNLQTWKFISIVKGQYQVLLYSVADKSRIWSMGSLSLKLKILHLQAWDLDFNMETQKIKLCTSVGFCIPQLDLLASLDFVKFGMWD